MHLWNDYEGSTIAGAFHLGALLRTEGRSASFTATDRDGRPAILRLTEALNDQEAIRARYRAIQSAAHPNLVAIQDFGDAVFEGTPLTYVVTEMTEESLAEILAVRRLSIEETGEVALSVSGGLEALHEHGLVHGLLEPASVLAVGEVIKLRTDCVRLAPEGDEGVQARYRDVFGLADVLHRSLTQQHLQEASDALALPEPYASIVRNVVRGTWGLDAVTAELRRYLRPATLPLLPTQPRGAQSMQQPGASFRAGATSGAGGAQIASLTMAPEVRTSGNGQASSAARPPARSGTQLEENPSFAETLAAAHRVVERAAAANISPAQAGQTGPVPGYGQSERSDAQPSLGTADETGTGEATRPVSSRGLAGAPGASEEETPGSWIQQRRGWVLGGAVLLVLLVMLLLHFLGSGSRPQPSSANGTSVAPVLATAPRPVQSLTAPMPQSSAPVGKPAAGVAAASSAKAPPSVLASALASAPADSVAPPAGGKVWRVVAYTYNREDQAAAKARTIAEHHPALRPVVFSRTGHAPFLVTLGEPMSEAQAAAMRQRARSEGLARDVYMQNYSR